MAIEEEVAAEEAVEEEFLNIDVSDALEEAPETEPTAEATETTESGPARDEHGRFAKKEEVAEGETPVEGAAQDTGAPAVAATPEATTPQVESLPFSFKVSGQEIPIDGAQYVPNEGLYIPDGHVPIVKQLLSEGAYYKQNWKTLESTAENKGYQRALSSAPEIQQAKALSDAINQLFEDPEKLAEAYNNWATMGPMYKEKALREMAERQLAELRQGSQAQQEEQHSQQLEQQKHQALSETITELKAVPDLKVLTPSDWQLFDKQVQLLNQRGGLYVEKDGELYLDTAAIEEIAAHVLSVRKQVVETAKKAEEAAKFNALNKPKAASAPKVTPRTGSAPKEKKPQTKDYRDVKREFLNMDVESDD